MLKKGQVRIYRVGPDGREFTLTVVGAGTVFGEMSLTAQRLENAYAEAMERVVTSPHYLRASIARGAFPTFIEDQRSALVVILPPGVM